MCQFPYIYGLTLFSSSISHGKAYMRNRIDRKTTVRNTQISSVISAFFFFYRLFSLFMSFLSSCFPSSFRPSISSLSSSPLLFLSSFLRYSVPLFPSPFVISFSLFLYCRPVFHLFPYSWHKTKHRCFIPNTSSPLPLPP